MPLVHVTKFGIKEQGLRYKLSLIGTLIFVIPFLILLYVLSRNPVHLEPSQLFIIALSLMLVLAGFIMLRQIFDNLLVLTSTIKKAAGSDEYLIHMRRETSELHEITDAFGMLMDRLEKTSAELKQKTLGLYAVKELSDIAGKISDSDSLLDALLEQAVTVTGARIGSVYMVDVEKRRFRIVASRGVRSAPKKNSYVAFDDSMVRQVVAERKPLVLQDNTTNARINGASDPPYGTPSFLSMPICAGGNLIATLNLSHIDAKDEQILSIMIDEVGFALENVMLLSEIEKHLESLGNESTVGLTAENGQLEREIVT